MFLHNSSQSIINTRVANSISNDSIRVKPNERNFMSCESRIFGHLLTSSQLILRRRVEQTAFLYETECSRNYATEISRLIKLRSFGFTLNAEI
jgi:hypothetical protein